jgi:hypothetical protein
MFVALGSSDNVFAYTLPEHPCTDDLAICTSDPNQVLDCVAGSIPDKGTCRCQPGKIHDGFGSCVDCADSCDLCNGRESTDCIEQTDFNLQATRIANTLNLNYHVNSMCSVRFERDGTLVENIVIVEADTVAVYQAVADFGGVPTLREVVTLTTTGDLTDPADRRGYCQQFKDGKVIVSHQAVHMLDLTQATITATELTLPSPYDTMSNTVELKSLAHVTGLDKMIVGSDASTEILIIADDSSTPATEALTTAPSSLTSTLENKLLVTYTGSSSTRSILLFDGDSISTTTDHNKASATRDMASIFVKHPKVEPYKSLYFVLHDENKLDVVNHEDGTIIKSITLPDWTSSDATKAGYITEIKYSNYVMVAREDESKVCLIEYRTETVTCTDTKMKIIGGIFHSELHRVVYIADKHNDFISINLLPEIGCGFDPLVESCGNQYYTEVTVTCKANSHHCRCDTGYFHQESDDTCQQCHTSCQHCSGPAEADCYEIVIEKASGFTLKSLATIDSRAADASGYRGIAVSDNGNTKFYSIDFTAKTATEKFALDFADESQDVVMRSRGGAIVSSGDKLRKIDLTAETPSEVLFSVTENFVFKTMVSTPKSQYFFTIYDSSADDDNKKRIFRYDFADETVAPMVYTTQKNVGEIYWKYNTHFVMVSPSEASTEREIFDATATHPTLDIGAIKTTTKPEDFIETLIVGPQDNRNIFFVLVDTETINMNDFTDGSLTKSIQIRDFNDFNPFTEIFKIECFGNSDKLVVLSNWHKIALWDYVADSVDYIDVGYNQMHDAVVFQDAKFLAISTAEIVRFIPIDPTFLKCTDLLADTCKTDDFTVSETCKTGASKVDVSENNLTTAYCKCDTDYNFDFETATCVHKDNSCFNTLALTCSGFASDAETESCVPRAFLDPIDNVCRCPLGTYVNPSPPDINSNRKCMYCPNHPEACTGPEVENHGELPIVRHRGDHDTKKLHGMCIAEHRYSDVATIETNTVTTLTRYFADRNDRSRFYRFYSKAEATGETTPKIGRCQHTQDGNVIIATTILRKTNIESTITFEKYDMPIEDGSIYGLIEKIRFGTFVITTIDQPSDPANPPLKWYKLDSSDLTGITEYSMAANPKDMSIESHYGIIMFVSSDPAHTTRDAYSINDGTLLNQFAKGHTELESTITIFEPEFFYAVTQGSNIRTYFYLDGETVNYEQTIAWPKVDNTAAVPNSYYMALSDYSQFEIIFVPVLEHASLTTKTIKLQYQHVYDIEFFRN